MIVRSIFLSILISLSLYANTILEQIDSINKKIPYATKGETVVYLHKLENLYISSVIKKDKSSITKSLRGIIRCRKLLGMDYATYEKELKSMGYKEPPKIAVEQKHKSNKRAKTTKKSINKNSKRIVKDIYIKDNTVVLKFNKKLNSTDLNFYTKKEGVNYIVAYEIKAKLYKNAPIYLNSTLDSIKIYQNRADYIELILKNRDKIYSKGFIRGGNLFVKINNKRRVVHRKLPSFERRSKEKPTTIVIDKKSIADNKKARDQKVVISSKSIDDSPLLATSKVIVIDPGHGGKDAGAVGYKNHYEKVAVLKIAKLVTKMLRKKGYRVYMTRDDDTFISLKQRTHLATQKNADLFISIHANAAPKGKRLSLKGIETFFLSPARTERAKRVAEKENRAASSLDRQSKDTVFDFLSRTKILQSNKLAIDIQSSILKQTRSKFRGVVDGGVREAPFWVLVGAQMPAVLIEIGYITNPMESDRLYNPFYQKALAKGIYNGINNYFAKNR